MQQGLTYSFFFAALHLPLGVSGNLSWSLRNRQSVFKMPPSNPPHGKICQFSSSSCEGNLRFRVR